MKEYIAQLEALLERIAQAMRLIDVPEKEQKAHALAQLMEAPRFWDRPEQAQQVSQEYAALTEEIAKWQQLHADASALLSFIHEMNETDAATMQEDIAAQVAALQQQFKKYEFVVLLSDPYDASNAIMAIHAGAGGTEAQDWAAMLLRMYTRYAEAKGWVVRIVDESRGQEAGFKSVTLHIHGRYAYGYLKGEHGVHRLVRISPFDAEKMRHTSFALVEVLPELDDTKTVQIDPKDLRIDTFMAGGHGGQSVNTTYSAVRVVHIPTGIVVSCQNERSQQQNRETAMKILRARLHRVQMEEQQKEKAALRGSFQSAAWGNQVRSYVLQPYQLVKDHRTDHETPDTDAVLSGEIDGFVEAYLTWFQAEKKVS